MVKGTVEFRQHFGYDVDAASDESAQVVTGESLTVQSQAEDADINVLMARYGITGTMPQSPVLPSYGDFSGIRDYQSALHAVMNAQDSFMELPAKVRARFDNDPQQFLLFCEDARNIPEARELGLLKEVAHVAGVAGADKGAGASGDAPARGAGSDGKAPGGAGAVAAKPAIVAAGEGGGGG